jgi:hypothetical protein
MKKLNYQVPVIYLILSAMMRVDSGVHSPLLAQVLSKASLVPITCLQSSDCCIVTLKSEDLKINKHKSRT